MMSLENRAGRLCEARFVHPCTVDETHALIASIRRIVAGSSARLVFCCDARRMAVFPPDVSELLTKVMRADNPHIEKNGLLFGDSSVFGLQIERMFREAGNPARRAFRARAELVAWIGETLSAGEKSRLAAFLDEGE